jgi:hypothetical protein
MNRTQIRYALFRCKAGTATKSQLKILDDYKSQLDEFGMDISDFTKEWDISKTDVTEVVTGKIARKYNQEQSLFSTTGQLK